MARGNHTTSLGLSWSRESLDHGVSIILFDRGKRSPKEPVADQPAD